MRNNCTLSSGLIRLIVIFMTLATITISTSAQGYNDPSQVNKRIDLIRQNSNGLVRLHKMAVSPGGIELLMMEIGSLTVKNNPAILVVGNMSGTTPVTTEAALKLAEKIVADNKLCAAVTWFILPMGNPDAYKRYFAAPLYMDSGNSTPRNDDNDDQTDEDGYNDLDANGIITQMRVKSPEGTWIPVASNPRLMRKADATKGEKGIYKLYTEGLDDDKDGQYNEDGIGGINVNENFPHLFKFFDAKTGLFPGSTPEAGELLKFSFAHPEIAMAISLGLTNYLLSPPKGGRKGSVDMDKITIPEEIGKAMGFDASRTYSMAEIMEAVQPMLPPGMVIDEGMIASFLGLGAIVNPIQEDLAFYNKISTEYKDYLKAKGVKEERLDPEDDKEGSFEMWAYYQLGVPIFSMDIWALNKIKEAKKESSGLTVESIEAMSKEDFVNIGEEKINAFLKEKGAPAQYTAKMVIGMVSGGQVTPKQLAGMMKQMPAPATDEQKGDPKELAQLAFSDSDLQGKGFINWKQFEHPDLGAIEIGGFVPFTANTPPYKIVDSLLNLHIPFIFELAKKLPKLHIVEVKSTNKGSGVYQIDVWIENEGILPFPTAMGKRDKIPAPAILTVEGAEITLLSGKKRTPVNDLASKKPVKMTWIIKTEKKGTLTIKLESKQAGSDTKQINIGG